MHVKQLDLLLLDKQELLQKFLEVIVVIPKTDGGSTVYWLQFEKLTIL